MNEKYGMLTIISDPYSKFLTSKSKQKTTVVNTKCECGNERTQQYHKIKRGLVASCGCAINPGNKTHGLSGSRLFTIWRNIKQRCYCVNNKSYKYYGLRGIKVCDEWLNGFMAFYNWSVANGYDSELEIERIDNNGNYEPSNCKWTTYIEQGRHKRNVKLSMENAIEIRALFHAGTTRKDLAQLYNISKGNIAELLRNGIWAQ